MVDFPTDMDGNFIRPGDKLFLEHNKKVITVRSVEFLEEGWIIRPYESGGGIKLPEASSDVKRLSLKKYKF